MTNEFVNTIAMVETFVQECRSGAITPLAAISGYTGILRAARREGGDLPFRPLARKVGVSLATVTRTFAAGRETLPQWQVVQEIVAEGLGAGPVTVGALRTAWAAAKEVVKPIGAEITTATTASVQRVAGQDRACEVCGLRLDMVDPVRHKEFHASYMRRPAPMLRVVRNPSSPRSGVA